MGRFINADDTSILQLTQGQLLGANLFAYCANNPVMNSDPSGYLYIKLASIAKIMLVVLGFFPVFATILAIGVYKLAIMITTKMALLGAKLGSFWGPVVSITLLVIFGAAGLMMGSEIAGALYDCFFLGKKGIEVKFKKSRWGFVYGLEWNAK